MRLLRPILILLLLLVLHATASARSRVAVVELDDTIQPATLRYIERALREAADREADLVVIELDTPGGVLESMRAMITAILRSEVPVAVYVTPSGARAASAGFFLLLAADVAAMAPGTNTGAAHPVAIGISKQREDDDKKTDPSLEKAVKDAAALARSLAERRKRDVKAAEQVVLVSTSFSAEEAHAKGLVDIVANDRTALLAQLDGRAITRFDGRTQTLGVRGAEIVTIERTLAERVLTLLANPQLAYLLLMLGAIGLLIELGSPGLVVPGVGGALCILLAMYGFSALPVDLIGALLIVAGVGLLVAEVLVTSYGVLAVAGIASFVVGSLMLVDTPVPALQIGPEVVVPVAAVLALLTAFLAVRAARSRRWRPHSGIDAMVGERGEVIIGIDPEHDGKVFVHGEYWSATSASAVPAGTKVQVDAIDGLQLRVTPVARQGEPP